MHIAQHLLTRGNKVIGKANLNNYYEIPLKETCLDQLFSSRTFAY